jgi:hypothetical protein
MAKASMRRVRYRSGDVFQIPFPDGSFGYGRILLDVFRLRRAGVFPARCALGGMCGSGLLVQLYRTTFPRPIPSVTELCRAPTFLDELLDHRQIYRAEFPIAGNVPVTASEIGFPEYACSYRPNPGEWHFTFEKGGIVAEIPITFAECEDLPRPSFSLGLVPEAVLRDIQDPLGREKHARGELRVDRRRNSILLMAGLYPTLSYDEMCAAVGGPTAEELLSAL